MTAILSALYFFVAGMMCRVALDHFRHNDFLPRGALSISVGVLWPLVLLAAAVFHIIGLDGSDYSMACNGCDVRFSARVEAMLNLRYVLHAHRSPRCREGFSMPRLCARFLWFTFTPNALRKALWRAK